ncbi:RNA polymerase subunit sigma-24 [Alphaproteobacteria bacterium AO1-B]|nr:RNA polymerase subunit sigma-24 [Alphaproteobacteria bacterium AO1-B]
MSEQSKLEVFEQARPRLLGLAYRLLGSWADAEDAVQDTFLRWQGSDGAAILNPDGWLTTACTNRCLDLLKSAHNKRVDYVGPWIPEPLHIEAGETPEGDIERAESLTIAFLHMMERLSPKERAAFLLHSVFGQSHRQVAGVLGTSESASRQLVSRASRHVQGPSARFVPPAEHQEKMLTAFLDAVMSGSTEQLVGLLSEGVQYQSDGGGKATALGRILSGSGDVSKYVAKIMSRLWVGSGGTLERRIINGIEGLALYEGGKLVSVVNFGYSADGLIDQIFIMRNPDKLRGMALSIRHDTGNGALQPN